MEENMRASMSRSLPVALIGASLAVTIPASACANVITDWDAKAIDAVAPLASAPSSPYTPYAAYRMMGLVHAAMFDAVNSIERRYRPYLVQLPADSAASKEAAAAAAAAAVLATIDVKTAAQMKGDLASYLASMPDGAKSEGVKLGEAVAAKILKARANDGCDAPDDYRPRTTPGVYVPTAIMRGPMWPNAKTFAMVSPSQFRPDPPVGLDSGEWAKDLNEIKDYGSQKSAKRTAEQTETARFWLVTGPVAYHPFLRQLAIAKEMDVVESARFMALGGIAINDALIAVLDAKYHFNFWRPVTATHPEYPCAHCILSGSVAGVVKAVLGTDDIPEVAMTSPTAPGVTHRWTSTAALTEEVANARIWSGFHYRFSTRVGTEMGYRIGEYVVKNVMQPVMTRSQ